MGKFRSSPFRCLHHNDIFIVRRMLPLIERWCWANRDYEPWGKEEKRTLSLTRATRGRVKGAKRIGKQRQKRHFMSNHCPHRSRSGHNILQVNPLWADNAFVGVSWSQNKCDKWAESVPERKFDLSHETLLENKPHRRTGPSRRNLFAHSALVPRRKLLLLILFFFCFLAKWNAVNEKGRQLIEIPSRVVNAFFVSCPARVTTTTTAAGRGESKKKYLEGALTGHYHALL